jgi:hypothetical protein
MSMIHCQTCSAELPLEDTDVVKFPAAGAHYQESTHFCPYCHTVVLLEVTLAEEDSPAAVDADGDWGQLAGPTPV